jgi:hypothetical protein
VKIKDSLKIHAQGGQGAEPPVVCRKLRTKMAQRSLVGARDWRYGQSTTAVYWCLMTMEPSGPDNNYAHPHGCQEGRGCFVPPRASPRDPVA